MKKRKIGYRILAAVMLVALSVGLLVGCGEKVSDEEVIKEGITEELESIKSLDDEVLDELSVESMAAELEPLGIDGKEFMKAYLEGFDYTIGDINVEDDTATVEITLKCKSFNDYNTALQNAANELTGDVEALASMSEDELNKKLGEVIMQTIGEIEVKETDPITLTYKLDDNTWTPEEDAETLISNAMLSN